MAKDAIITIFAKNQRDKALAMRNDLKKQGYEADMTSSVDSLSVSRFDDGAEPEIQISAGSYLVFAWEK